MKPKQASPEEVKREEEMVDDEMKEDDQEDSKKEAMRNYLTMMKLFASNPAMARKMLAAGGNNGTSTEEPGKAINSILEKLSGTKEEAATNDDDALAVSYEDDDASVHSSDAHDSHDGFGQPGGNAAAAGGGGDERKVRVRTLISEEQLTVLKTYYQVNPRPKREELEKIAAKIGHPFKVVKVWFQNSRARDRREGKPVSFMPGGQPGQQPGQQPFLAAAAAQIMGSGQPFFAGIAGSPLLAAGTGGGLFPPLPQGAAAAAGILPNLGAASKADQPSNGVEATGSKSPSSSVGGDCDQPIVVGGGGPNQQPLDLSNKGSSPSASPVSDNGGGRFSPIKFPVGFPFAAAAAAAANGFPTMVPPMSTAAAAASESESEDSGQLFPCDQCDKTFTKRSSLQRHKYDHSGEKN